MDCPICTAINKQSQRFQRNVDEGNISQEEMDTAMIPIIAEGKKQHEMKNPNCPNK